MKGDSLDSPLQRSMDEEIVRPLQTQQCHQQKQKLRRTNMREPEVAEQPAAGAGHGGIDRVRLDLRRHGRARQ